MNSTDAKEGQTPRTDAIAKAFFPGGWINMNEAETHYNFLLAEARQLERENNDLRQQLDAIRK